ncbi:MAG: efflux transporter outer membrane subunit [Myxococcota bacterium]|nr:efflux transporter outer membrane subunit [Myxococcota bacterium]
MRPISSLPILALILSLLACGGPSKTERRPLERLPSLLAVSPQGENAPQLNAGRPWWQEWEAVSLNTLMEQLFRSSLSLAQARARFLQLRSLSIQAGSERWPSLNLSASVSERKQLNNCGRAFSTGAPGAPAPPSSFTLQTYGVSLGASYEVDVWGRIGAQVRAAERDEEAAAAELRALAVTLSASLAELWLQLIEQEQSEKLLREQAERERALLSLTELRFEQGLRPVVDSLQQAQRLAQVESQLPLFQARIAQLRRQINALLGRYQGGVDVPELLPELPDLPKIPLPAELLSARPDLQAARLRVIASDERVAAAFAARLPAFRLSADVGLQAFELDEILEDIIWGWAVNLAAPLFQAGRLEAAQQVRAQQLREQLSAWGELTIKALHEVEDAVSQEQALSTQVDELRRQEEGAEALYEAATRRYQEGVGDLLTVLNANQGLSQAQQGLLAARRGRLSAHIQLHRALGGGWSERVLEQQLEQEIERTRQEEESE